MSLKSLIKSNKKLIKFDEDWPSFKNSYLIVRFVETIISGDNPIKGILS
jgi:hypothetical protein